MIVKNGFRLTDTRNTLYILYIEIIIPQDFSLSRWITRHEIEVIDRFSTQRPTLKIIHEYEHEDRFEQKVLPYFKMYIYIYIMSVCIIT